MGANPLLAQEKVIVFFDTNCLLCSRFVNFLLKHDRGEFYYSGFESVIAQDILPAKLRNIPQTIVLCFKGSLLFKSDAVFHIIRHMGFPWRLIGVFRILPKKFSNAIYDMISRNRSAWFGRSDNCYLRTEDQKGRFF